MATTHAPPGHKPVNGAAVDRRHAGPVRRRDRPSGAGRLVLVEIAAACGLLTLVRPVWWVFLLDAVALGALALGFVRVSGQWWVQRVGQRRRFRQRRAALAAAGGSAAGPTAGPAALTALAGHLAVRTIELRGVPVGVAEDADGWFATVELSPPPDLRADAPPVPLHRQMLAGLLDDRTTAPTLVQAITHTVPAPTVELAGGVPASWAYRTKLDGRPVPAGQLSWVSVRLDAGDAPRVAASHGGADAIARAVAGMAVRAVRSLHAVGVAGRVLDEAGLRTALSRSCVLPEPSGDRRGEATGESAGEALEERWTDWRADGLCHVSFALSGWPAPRAAASVAAGGDRSVDGEPDPDEVLAELCAVPAVATSLAVILTRRPDGLASRCLLRIVSPPELAGAAADQVVAIARRAGVRVQRLDGRHGPAVYASAPTGGGYR